MSPVPGMTIAAHFLASSPVDALPLAPGTASLPVVVTLGRGLKAANWGMSLRFPQAGTRSLWKWNVCLT